MTRAEKLAVLGPRIDALANKVKSVDAAISACVAAGTGADWTALQNDLVVAYGALKTEVDWGVGAAPLLNDDNATPTDPPE